MPKLHPLAERLNELQTALAEHLPWSPWDFVPEISRAGDRQIWADHLARPLPHENDFRFETRGPGDRPIWILAERLPWDSEFFGYGVARLHGIFPADPLACDPAVDLDRALARLLKRLRKRDIRYLVCHVDPRDLALLRALGACGGVLLETRYLHYGPVVEPALGERFPVRRATNDDVESLAVVAAETVNPFDRFHADPFVDRQKTAQLMRRWVEESVAGRMADVVIVPDVPNPKAFVTYRYHRQHWPRWGVAMAQGVLSAVAPEAIGWMDRLGNEVAYHLFSQGVRFASGSTQVTNRPIIWFAQEAGARFGKCEHVLRCLP